ncbi:CHASE2 domain-containing protein [Anaerotignum sp.]|nr:adenylate/guanylate cyclase domain-containing protein [Anaerotignum sp.]MBQ7757428.1 adenylate/guanylate cyclase domain-containing protein [Anaerotignum sp.]
MKHLLETKRILSALLAATLMTGIAASGLLYQADNTANDSFYQQERALDGNIFVIGIDAYSLEELGPFQTWGRSYMAQAVEMLNQNPDCKPAAIGVDVLYAGLTEEGEDAALVEALGKYDNVVTASAANFASELVTEADGTFYMDDYYVESYDEPFPALQEVTTQGHINAMYDADGIMRHAIWAIDLSDGRQVNSFAYELYAKYCAHFGMEADANPPADERYRWYVPFSGKPGAYYDDFSFSDLMNGNIPAEIFADSIVLIGPYATGLMDHVTTSIDHSEVMYGVEYQANVVDALLRGQFVKEVSDVPQLAALFVVAFLLVLFSYKQKIKVSTALWVAAAGGYLAIAKLAYSNGYLLHVLWIPLFSTIIYVALMAYNYLKAAKERRQITNTFKHYVAPEVVNELLKNKDALELGGKLTDIACLFVDIRGFTPMSELLTPPQVVEILNRYLDLTSRCIMQNGGTLDKFVGDATMAIFNAPLPQEDYIYKAVKTALDMVEGSKALSDELQEQFGRTVQFGIGVHCGQAVVGNIGASIRMDYTAIGDTVNTAARLESNAPGGQILISRAVADALEGRIRVTSLGDSIKLKGKSAGFEILRVDGLMEE